MPSAEACSVTERNQRHCRTRPATVAREVDMPDELTDAMDADPILAEAFHALTPGRQKKLPVQPEPSQAIRHPQRADREISRKDHRGEGRAGTVGANGDGAWSGANGRGRRWGSRDKQHLPRTKRLQLLCVPTSRPHLRADARLGLMWSETGTIPVRSGWLVVVRIGVLAFRRWPNPPQNAQPTYAPTRGVEVGWS